MQIYLGQKVRHKDLYVGKETFEVVGIRKDEVELEGDYSGGTHNVKQKAWQPKKGLITQNVWGNWEDPDDDFFNSIYKNAGRRD